MSEQHELHYTPNSLLILGVKEVIEFSENEIVLSLQNSGLKLNGKELKLIEVDLDKGVLRASGSLHSFNYGGVTKESILKKLFK